MGIKQTLLRHRAFVREVGIIVLGVLLALGAQQVVEAIAMRGRVAEFRKAVHGEMAGNLWYGAIQSRQVPCLLSTLGSLEEWLGTVRDGQEVRLSATPRPVTFGYDTAVWNNRDPEVFAAMPARERLMYGQFYDTVPVIERSLNRIRDRLYVVRQLELAGPLTAAERRQMYEAVSVTRSTLPANAANLAILTDMAAKLKIAVQPPVWVDRAYEQAKLKEATACPRVVERSGA